MIGQFTTCFVKPFLYDSQEKLFNSFREKLIAESSKPSHFFPYLRSVDGLQSPSHSTNSGEYTLYYDKDSPCPHPNHLLCQCTRIALKNSPATPTKIRFCHAVGRDEQDPYPSLVLTNSEYNNMHFMCDTCISLPSSIHYTEINADRSAPEAVVLLLHPKSPEGQLNNCDAIDRTKNVTLVLNSGVSMAELKDVEVNGVTKLVIPKDAVRLRHCKVKGMNQMATFADQEELILTLDSKSARDRAKVCAKYCGLCALPLGNAATCCLVGLLFDTEWHECEKDNQCISKWSESNLFKSQIDIIASCTYHAACGDTFRQRCTAEPLFIEWWCKQKDYLISLLSSNSCWMINQSVVQDPHSTVQSTDQETQSRWERYIQLRCSEIDNTGNRDWEIHSDYGDEPESDSNNLDTHYNKESLRIWSDVDIYLEYKNDITSMCRLPEDLEKKSQPLTEESTVDSANSSDVKKWENVLNRIDQCLGESQLGHETYQTRLNRRSSTETDDTPAGFDETSVYIPDAGANGNCFFYALHAIFRNHSIRNYHRQTATSSSARSRLPALCYRHTFRGTRLPSSTPSISDDSDMDISRPATSTATTSNSIQPATALQQPAAALTQEHPVVGTTIVIPINNVLSAIMAMWLHLTVVDENNHSIVLNNLASIFLRADYLYFSRSEGIRTQDLKQLIIEYGVLPVLHARAKEIYNRVQTPQDGLNVHAGLFEAAQMVYLFGSKTNLLRLVLLHGEGVGEFEDSIIQERNASRIVIDMTAINSINKKMASHNIAKNLVTLRGSFLIHYITSKMVCADYQAATQDWRVYSENLQTANHVSYECYLQHRSTSLQPFVIDPSHGQLELTLFSSFRHFDPILFFIKSGAYPEPNCKSPFMFFHCNQKLTGLIYSTENPTSPACKIINWFRKIATVAAKSHARYCYLRNNRRGQEYEIQNEDLFDAAVSTDPSPVNASLQRRKQQYQSIMANLARDKNLQMKLFSELYVATLHESIKRLRSTQQRESDKRQQQARSCSWYLFETVEASGIFATHLVKNKLDGRKYIIKTINSRQSSEPMKRKLKKVLDIVSTIKEDIRSNIFVDVKTEALNHQFDWLSPTPVTSSLSSPDRDKEQVTIAPYACYDFYAYDPQQYMSIHQIITTLDAIDVPIASQDTLAQSYALDTIKYNLCTKVIQVARLFMQHSTMGHAQLTPFNFLVQVQTNTSSSSSTTVVDVAASATSSSSNECRLNEFDPLEQLMDAAQIQDQPARNKQIACLLSTSKVHLVGYEYMIPLDLAISTSHSSSSSTSDVQPLTVSFRDSLACTTLDSCVFVPPVDASMEVHSEDDVKKLISASSIFTLASTIIFIVVGSKAYNAAFQKTDTSSKMRAMHKRLNNLLIYYQPTFQFVLGPNKYEALKYMIMLDKSIQKTHELRTDGMVSFVENKTLKELVYNENTPLSSPAQTSSTSTTQKNKTMSTNTTAARQLDVDSEYTPKK